MPVDRKSVPLLVPDLPDRHALEPYLRRIDESRLYSNFGPLNGELEARMKALFSEHADGLPIHVSTVANATLGLELALSALHLPPGSRVLVPALTFVATATAIVRAGLRPLIADIDERNWLLTPEIAMRSLRDKDFQAVLPVAAFGCPHDVAQWHAFERQTDVPVVIDAAGAFSNQWLNAPGTLVFSLHATKSMPAGEGGMVVSTDAALVKRIRQMSNFGINLDPGLNLPVGTLRSIGSNAKLSEYHAAVGLASLAQWPQRAALRAQRWQHYRRRLETASDGTLIWQAGNLAAPTILCVRHPDGATCAAIERNCQALGVQTRRWYQPLLHRHPVLAAHSDSLSLDVAESLAPQLLGLPFFPELSDEQMAHVAGAIGMSASTPRSIEHSEESA